MSAPHVSIYTDGACSGNPGPGGWGAVLLSGRHRRQVSGYEAESTNNRMELTTALAALEVLTTGCSVDLYTDSVYLRKGMTTWLATWRRNGWRTAAGKPVKNADLWRSLDELTQRHEVRWHWVRGHAGHPENECADGLARAAVQARTGCDTGRVEAG